MPNTKNMRDSFGETAAALKQGYRFTLADILGAGVLGYNNVFYVHSGRGSNQNDGSEPARAFASIDYAVGQCQANRGDIIVALPAHTETVSAAAGLDLDVAGITVFGIPGHGADRATVNFTTATTADMDVDAVNITMQNILFTGGIDALAAPIDVNFSDFTLYDVEMRDVTGQVTDFLLTVNTADRLLIDGLVYDGAAAAGTNAAIAINGGDRHLICNFLMDGNFAVGGIDIRTTATTDLDVYSGRFRTRNNADIFLIDTITASTGNIGPNLYLRLQENAANITEAITGATFVLHQKISVVNLAGEVGMEINTTASTDAIV